MRLFVGIAVADEIAARLEALQPASAPGIRRIGRADMHVTLHFLGDCDPETTAGALAAVRAPGPLLCVRGVGQFRLRGGRRVLWAGVVADAALLALHTAVADALAVTGFAPEARPYQPHITLARLGHNAAEDAVERLLAERSAEEFGDFSPDRFHLYDTAAPGSPDRYRRLESYRFAG
jgi:2'-5' RNA ligase